MASVTVSAGWLQVTSLR